MILITGDCHGSMDIDKIHNLDDSNMTADDYVIVCGDMGIIWNYPENKEYENDIILLDWWNEKKFTTLFIDGNHENHDVLSSYDVTNFLGGKVHKLSDKVYHLMRGEVYDINGKKFFAFGGASSVDKKSDKESELWWYEELPNICELENGLINLKKNNFKVDYVITHAGPIDIVNNLFSDKSYRVSSDILVEYLQDISRKIDFQIWYFGHYHFDIESIDGKYVCLYNNIIDLK